MSRIILVYKPLQPVCQLLALALRPKFLALAFKLKSLALQPEALPSKTLALVLLCLVLVFQFDLNITSGGILFLKAGWHQLPFKPHMAKNVRLVVCIL